MLNSLVYHKITDNFYNDPVNNPLLLDIMDTSNLPTTHLCNIAEHRGIPEFFQMKLMG